MLMCPSRLITICNNGQKPVTVDFEDTEHFRAWFYIDEDTGVVMPGTEFDLPGGGKMEYPVSQGIVSLQTASDTPFDSYLDVQNRIAQAFDDIRTHLAQRQFGKPYSYYKILFLAHLISKISGYS